jgi:hypothetical protein
MKDSNPLSKLRRLGTNPLDGRYKLVISTELHDPRYTIYPMICDRVSKYQFPRSLITKILVHLDGLEPSALTMSM